MRSIKEMDKRLDEREREIERLNKENNDLINNNNYWKRKCSELNNIINEIQTMCKNEYYRKNTTDIDSIGISNNIWVMIYLKIKELKENKYE